MFTELISNFAIACLEATGYYGAAALMALESMIFPIPSEAVMPFVGFLVMDGKWDLWPSVLATSFGSLLGSFLSYILGYYGGKPLVLKVGRYLLLNQHDLTKTEHFFHRRSGALTLFISRFIPVIRHLISIPAGTGQMPLLLFLATTLLGATIWNSFLLLCGMKLREHWHIVMKYSHQVDLIVMIFLLAGAVWFVRSRLAKRN